MNYDFFQYGHLQLSAKSGWTGCYASHIILEPNTAVFKVNQVKMILRSFLCYILFFVGYETTFELT